MRDVVLVDAIPGIDEGTCFCAVVTVDDRRVGIAQGDGHRPPSLHVANTEMRLVIEAEADTLYPDAEDAVATLLASLLKGSTT